MKFPVISQLQLAYALHCLCLANNESDGKIILNVLSLGTNHGKLSPCYSPYIQIAGFFCSILEELEPNHLVLTTSSVLAAMESHLLLLSSTGARKEN